MATSGSHVPLVEEIEGHYGIIRFFANDTVIGSSLRLYGEWAENELRFFRNFIPRGGTVLDVGGFIGTHALAFARMVGPEGQVHSFEPQARSFALLEENVQTNAPQNVLLHRSAVGAAPGRIILDPMNIDDPTNFGGLTVHAGQDGRGAAEEADVITIDSLCLTRLDFIKLDVEGSEDAALRGAVRTISDLRPVIYAECNSLEDAARSFAELKSFGYALFLHVVDAFNPENKTGETHNIFGLAREAGIIAVPAERRTELAALTDPSWELFELDTLDDLAYGLLQKPQYFDEILRAGAAARAGGKVVSAADYRGLEHARAAVTRERDLLQASVHREEVVAEQLKSQLKTALASFEAVKISLANAEQARAKLEGQLDAQRGDLERALNVLRSTEATLGRIKKSNVFKLMQPIIKAEMSLRDKTRKRRRAGGSVPETPAVMAPTPALPLKAKRNDRVATLRIQALPGTEANESLVSNRQLMLCVSHVPPCPPRAGNEFRLLRMVHWLQATGLDVLLVICPLPGEELSPIQLTALGAEFPNVLVVGREGQLEYKLTRQDLLNVVRGLDGVRVRDFASVLREDRASGSRLLSLTRSFCPDPLMETLAAVDAGARPFAVLVNYCFMTRCFALLRSDVLKIVDTIDVFSTKQSKVVRFGIKDSLALTTAEERHLLSEADALLAIQAEEALELRGLGVSATVITVGVDMPEPPAHMAAVEAPVALMVGSDNEMNRKGLKDFLRFAWPLIRAAVPEARLNVVGSVGKELSGHELNVTWLGRIDDLDGAYAQSRLAINPAVAGTGLKVKTLEALSRLRPIVLWPSGVDGVSAELREYCTCVQDWFLFAESVIRILQDPAAGSRLLEARGSIARLLSPDHVYADFSAFLNGQDVHREQSKK